MACYDRFTILMQTTGGQWLPVLDKSRTGGVVRFHSLKAAADECNRLEKLSAFEGEPTSFKPASLELI